MPPSEAESVGVILAVLQHGVARAGALDLSARAKLLRHGRTRLRHPPAGAGRVAARECSADRKIAFCTIRAAPGASRGRILRALAGAADGLISHEGHVGVRQLVAAADGISAERLRRDALAVARAARKRADEAVGAARSLFRAIGYRRRDRGILVRGRWRRRVRGRGRGGDRRRGRGGIFGGVWAVEKIDRACASASHKKQRHQGCRDSSRLHLSSLLRKGAAGHFASATWVCSVRVPSLGRAQK